MMNWDAIGAIGEIVGASAVFVSLLYLAIQTKQNTRAMKSASFHEVRMAFSDISFGIAQNSELVAMMAKLGNDPDSLTKEELVRYEMILLTLVRRAESAYFQSQEGALAQGSWAGISTTCIEVISDEVARAWWNRMQHRFEQSFRDELNGLLAVQRNGAVESGEPRGLES